MPVDVVLSIITAVASALDYAHRQGLLHRDVKPANIMLTHVDDDGEQRILLTDFGIARSVDDISGLTSTNMSVGTVAYAAPEQLMGEEIDGRADQYALAATAYHLLTGLQLFAHSNPAVAISRHLNADPPAIAETRPELAALDPVLAAALAKNPDQRFASCSDFARALADQVSPTSLAIPIAPTASAPLPLGASSVDAVAEDSDAEKVSSHHAPEVANDPADSASNAPTQQAPVSAGKARLAESDEIEPPPTPRSPMRGGTSQAPQQSEPSSVSSTPAPIPVLAVPPKSRFPQLRLRLPGNLGTDDKIILALGIVLLVLLLTGVLS
jgi:serine/threonine-protein kinase